MPASFNSSVDVTVEIAFGYAPYNTSPVWTDVSSDVRFIQFNRGRSHSLDQVGAGRLRLVLDNIDGAYDPTYTTGANYPDVVPMVPVRVRAVHSTITYDLFRGFITSWPMTWTLSGDATVEVDAMDGIFLLNLTNSGSAQAQELSSVRVGNLLDDTSWPAAWRSISTGDVTCVAFTPDCGVVWELIDQVVATEGGLAFIDGAGDFVFQNRDHRSGATSTMTFGDSGAEIRYEDISLTYDETQIWNRVEVSRVDGPTVGSDSTTSITNYGRRLLTIADTLHIGDTEATTHSSNMLTRWKDPHVHLQNLRINLGRADSWANLLGLQISDLVTVKRRPPAGNTISLDVFIEGFTMEITPDDRTWMMNLVGTQYV